MIVGGLTSPRAIAAPAPARTQTGTAVAHMTTQSRSSLPTALLDAHVGRSTLAGALNRQIRFRVEQHGEPRDWALVPDSKLAADLLASPAGPALARQLHTAIETTGTLGRASNLKGFVLPQDLDGVIAARALAFLEDPNEPDGVRLAKLGAAGATREAGALLQSWRPAMAKRAERAGAWNGEGWITFLPHTARAMLVAAGAYRPQGSAESYLRQARARTDFIAGNASHEVQHSVTNRTPSATFTWMEEGIANVFSRTPAFQSQLARRGGLSPHAYAGHLAHAPSFETGWAPYRRPARVASSEDQATHDRSYVRSQDVLRDLARMAGADFRSRAGRQTAFDLLQGQSLRFVPGRLADAIIERHGLDPSVRERLRASIKVAVDHPRGARDIAREFGIDA